MSSQSDPDASSSSSSSITTTTQSTSTAKAVSIPSRIPPGTCFHQNIVTVEIGAEKKVYSIHKDLLVFYCDYFRAAFNGSFTEAAEGKISLPHERVDVVNIVAKFIYTRQLSDGVNCDIPWEVLCRVWIFGDKYQMPALQNKAMNTLLKRVARSGIAPTHCIKLIYDNTCPGSPLRGFIVDLVVWKGNISDIMGSEKCQQWPQEAFIELVRAFGAQRDGGIGVGLPEGIKDKCYYHVHKDDEKC
ncbi:hypothetical protein E4T50_06206 [Aureobasidium sp. EXF-12298]|nr:hypothetical protein E4T50_06206 [Aureobasidium sp. EXF-12298]KAI4759414.1 hypothetical protein E4T51_07559 [Aureobasidium sp. EXF-12344]KAI4777439.1 hypothetical protein E4T52_07617 [Aureobasidium sp. EXF-3400]